MKTIQATYGRAVTVVETEGKASKVNMFKTKKMFYDYITNKEFFAIRVSQNVKGVINKIKSIGFNVEVDESYGFDYEVKLYCDKIY